MSGVEAETPVPRVLVLMAAYNGAPWIAEQLASILEQRGVSVLVRVSDDRSTDDTAGVVRRLMAQHGNLILDVRSEASGGAGANFRGLLAQADIAACDYVALADQDDLWDPDHLLRACRSLQADPSAGGRSCAVRTFGQGAPVLLTQAQGMRRLDFLFEGAGQGCTFMLTLDTARRVQELCQQRSMLAAALQYHDWLIYLVTRCSGRTWIFDPHASVRYRQHGANVIGARSGSAAVRRRLSMIRGGWYRSQVEAALALVMALAPGDARIARFGSLWREPSGLARKLRLALWVSRDARRRRGDRLVVVAAALLGWL